MLIAPYCRPFSFHELVFKFKTMTSYIVTQNISKMDKHTYNASPLSLHFA
jgi:hypothetical protein